MNSRSDEELKIIIDSTVNNYTVYFMESFENQLNLQNYDLILIDTNVYNLYKKFFQTEKTLTLSISENNKNLQSVFNLLGEFEINGLKKSSRVLCIGGGCLQDVATLSTSLYMRGISWDFVPTTLQSMADSCIGGKSSINSNNSKNIVGNYFPPTNIYICTEFINSLPKVEIFSGLMEIMKICYAKDQKLELTDISKMIEIIISQEPSQINRIKLKSLIYKSLVAKKYFIEIDEFDSGPRKLLNFGHTFGHAIEIYSQFKINHGMAVGVGMLCAAEMSKAYGLNQEFVLEDVILKILFNSDEVFNLLKNGIDAKELINILKLDKKSTKSSLNFIIPVEAGLKIYEVYVDSELSIKLAEILANVTAKFEGIKN